MIEKLTRFHDRAMATFIIDDVCGHEPADAEAFLRFSGWAEESGLKGECSAILGLKRTADGRPLPFQKDYAKEVERAAGRHLDANMEVMTHLHLFDFAARRMRDGGSHEGVWLMDRRISQEQYYEYFDGIAKMASEAGFKHSGLTLPGCGCDRCMALKRELVIKSPQAIDLNRNALRALLQLAKEGRLATPVCSLFVGKFGYGPVDCQELLSDGRNTVYDVPPAVGGDTLGRWDNLPEYLDLDQYITADGEKGRLVELIALRTQTMGFYGHWQAIRPDRGIGYTSFQELGRRVKRHLGECVEWMRPTEIAMYRHTERYTQVREEAGGRGFSVSIPFEPLHVVSVRVLGNANAHIRTPSGRTISPWKALPGQACAIFDILPENGRYEVVE
jgi:hypothetical protein